MFTADDDEPPFQAAATEMWERSSSSDLDEELAKLGVYVHERAIIVQDGPAGPEPSVLFAGVLGRLAFVDPDASSTDDAFDELVEETIAEDFNAVRRDLLDGPGDG